MVRAFTAVNIEDEKVIEELREVQKQIDLGFRLIKPEKMHITFEFFKNASEKEIRSIKAAMDDLQIDSFQLEINGLGAFPSKDYIRVIWAGAESSEIHEVHKQLQKHDANASTENDFKPHVTLARVDRISDEKKKKLQRILKEYQDHSFGSFELNSIKLYRSDLKPDGAVYEEIHSVEL